MSIKRIILLSLFIFLSACGDVGSRGKDCGVSATNSHLVEGMNNESCREDKFLQGFAIVHKDMFEHVVSDTSEAKLTIQADIESNAAKKILQDRSSITTKNDLKTMTTLVIILAVYYFGSGIFVLLISRMREEKTFDRNTEQMNPDKKQEDQKEKSEKALRYNNDTIKANIIGMALALFATLPVIEGTYPIAARVYGAPLVLNSLEIESLVHSFILAGSQKGKLTESESLSETSRKYSVAYFKSYSLITAMDIGSLSENRTSKLYYELMNNDSQLNGGEKRVEAPKNTQAIFYENGKIVFKRLINGKQISYNADIIFESKPLNSRRAQEAYNKLSPSYITNDPNKITDNGQQFELAMKQELGISDTTPDIQLALVSLVNESVRESLLVKLNADLPKFYEFARLKEELICSVKEGTNKLAQTKDATRAIKWLKNEINESGFIGCVGQVGKEFVVYGNRSAGEVIEDMNTKYHAFLDSYYLFFQKIESSVFNITLNDSNSESCIKARKEGFLTMEDKNCLIRSNANRDLVNAVMTSFRAKGYGESSFVQTNYFRNNNLKSPIIANYDFDPILKNLYSSVNITTDFEGTDNKEFIDTLSDSYQDDKLSSGSMTDMIFKPTQTLKASLRITDDCDMDELTACMSPFAAYAGLRDYTQKLDKLSFWLVSSTFMIGAATAEANRLIDKSATKNVEITQKGKVTKKSVIRKSFEFLIKKTTGVGVGLWTVSKLIQFEMVMPDILTFVVKATYAVFVYMFFYIVAFRFINLFYINDKNNFVAHIKKMCKEAVYILFYPTILTIFGFVVIQFSAFQAMMAIEIIASLAKGGSFNDYIVSFLFTLPVLHFLNSNVLRQLVDFLNYFIKQTIGTNQITKTAEETLNFMLKMVTLGFPTFSMFALRRNR